MTMDAGSLPEFLTLADVKEFFGLRSSTWTAAKLSDRFGIQFFKVGKSFYIHRQKFLERFKAIMEEEHNE